MSSCSLPASRRCRRLLIAARRQTGCGASPNLAARAHQAQERRRHSADAGASAASSRKWASTSRSCQSRTIRSCSRRLIAGDLDSFEGGPSGAMIADAHGADVKVIGCTWLTVPHGIFVHDDITAMDQLKGKTSPFRRRAPFPTYSPTARWRSFQYPRRQREIRQPRRRSRPLQGAGRARRRCRRGVGRIRADRREGAHQDAGSATGSAAAIPAHVPADDRRDAQAARPEDAAKFLAGEMLGLRYAVGA